jgi:hypothetical protein
MPNKPLEETHTKDIANHLWKVASAGEISVAEFRRLFLFGLAALLKETDSMSYRIGKVQKLLEDKKGGTFSG